MTKQELISQVTNRNQSGAHVGDLIVYTLSGLGLVEQTYARARADAYGLTDGLNLPKIPVRSAYSRGLRAAINHCAGTEADRRRFDIRRAARAGAAAANKEIDSALAMLEGLGVGTSATAGRVERRALAAKLASFVGDRERIKRIAEIAGRLRRVAAHKQAQKNQGIGYVAGVEQGRDLPRVLPQEVQLFMNPATSLLFLEKYNTRQLFQTKQENREPESKGPIVMCLDASGSMSGAPSEWGAAVALAFLDVARKQRRDFCLLHFNGAVIRCDRFDAKAPVDAAAALDMIAFNHANGGTSFRAALTGALEIIEAPGAFAKADVVFVTDGQGESDLTSLRERLKAREVSVYGVQVASASVSPSLAAICDEAVTVRETVDDAAIHNFFAKV